MRRLVVVIGLLLSINAYGWGFFGHRKINEIAVYLLPPEMLVFYKTHVDYLIEHAVDPDKRRYAIREEGPRHFIDLDRYGRFPFDSLPRSWNKAVEKFGEDSLQAHGIGPWWIQVTLGRLTNAFKEKDGSRILKYSAELGHYIADAHVPLHTSSNHNGQFTDQKGIHGFWESRVPELLADREWDFFIGRSEYIADPLKFAWARILESAAAVDSVLGFEKKLTQSISPDRKYAFEERNGVLIRQYSNSFTRKYDLLLNGMIERRMRQSIYSVACFWLTAWVNAGQPSLAGILGPQSKSDSIEFEKINAVWRAGGMQEH